jgi:hypothetical protein
VPIIGIALNAMNARKIEEIAGSVKINSNMNITQVKEQMLPALNCKGLSIEFDFMIKYQDEKDSVKAEIGMEGSVIYMGEDAASVEKDWKKDKKLPEDLKFQVVRIVSEKCSKKAIMISDDLQLPPPPLLITQQGQQAAGKKPAKPSS